MGRRRRRIGPSKRQIKQIIKKIGMELENHSGKSLMDETHVFAPHGSPKNEVVLGVYSAQEWVTADYLRKRHTSGRTTIQHDITWIPDAGFKLTEWAEKNSTQYTFFGADNAIFVEDNGIMSIFTNRGKLNVEFIGDPQWARAWIKDFDDNFRRAESLIEWVYSTRGDEVTVPLNYRPAVAAAYPWLKKPIVEYIDDYLNSDASILILIGPPGTGKTTFIKNLIHRSGGNAKVAYDEKVMNDDGLFASFIDDDSRFLIMEDADAFLAPRADGNTMMHKFLNVSDGLISAADKKLVFSTNLPNIRDIDPALMRPGRCYDVIEFRALTNEEARQVVKETGKGLVPVDDRSVTLAEIFSQQPSQSKRKSRGIGFTA